MTDLRHHLRAIAEALPTGSALPVPVELLLDLLATPTAPPEASAKGGAGTPDERLLTVQEVAARFGISEDWLYRHWRAIGGMKLGRKVLRFPASAVQVYLAAQRKAL